MSPDALVDHLEATHHAYLHAELPRLSALADKVAGVHGARHPGARRVQRTYEAIRADLEPHLAKEEQVLFPMIRELVAATAAPEFHCGSRAEPDLGDAAGARLRSASSSRRCGASPTATRRRPTAARATGRCSTGSPRSRPTPTCTSTRRTTSSSRPSSPSKTS